MDARSVSRVGVSDLGANAARLRAFSARLRGRFSGAELARERVDAVQRRFAIGEYASAPVKVDHV